MTSYYKLLTTNKATSLLNYIKKKFISEHHIYQNLKYIWWYYYFDKNKNFHEFLKKSFPLSANAWAHCTTNYEYFLITCQKN